MNRPADALDSPAAPRAGSGWDASSDALVPASPEPSGPPAPLRDRHGRPCAAPRPETAEASGQDTGPIGAGGPAAHAAGDAGGGSVPGRTAVRAPEIAYHPAGHKQGVARRGPADPVKSLMHRHRELCERAVDPLEIAAGLEAHGLTDRTAARYRHRDVFSLAEELYARVPGAQTSAATSSPPPGPDTEARAGWTLLALLPGAACLATAGTLRATEEVLGGEARFAVTAAGALLVTTGLRLCLRGGPLRAPDSAGAVGVYGCWLLGFVVYGEDLLVQVLSGGPDGNWTAAPAPLLGLSLAVAPAAWCAHLFSVHARRKLAGSRELEEFGAGVRPLLLGVLALFLCALVPLLLLAGLGYGAGGTPVGSVALGVLLFLARLLTVHGFPEPAATGLAAACAVEMAAPFLVLAGRLPGLGLLARPVDTLVTHTGTGGVAALACGAAALGLLLHAAVALSRASAHAAA